jgi:hypothetical protein
MPKKKARPVDWDALELQAHDLRYEPMSPEDRLRKAQKLAARFREHGQPLPNCLAVLL